MSKHTPGPWEVRESVFADINGHNHLCWPVQSSLRDGVERRTGTGVVICPAEDLSPENKIELVANARLIAAAPELLSACENLAVALTDMIGNVGADDYGNLLVYVAPEDTEDARATIRAAWVAIAKAKGETP